MRCFKIKWPVLSIQQWPNPHGAHTKSTLKHQEFHQAAIALGLQRRGRGARELQVLCFKHLLKCWRFSFDILVYQANTRLLAFLIPGSLGFKLSPWSTARRCSASIKRNGFGRGSEQFAPQCSCCFEIKNRSILPHSSCPETASWYFGCCWQTCWSQSSRGILVVFPWAFRLARTNLLQSSTEGIKTRWL